MLYVMSMVVDPQSYPLSKSGLQNSKHTKKTMERIYCAILRKAITAHSNNDKPARGRNILPY